MSIAAPIKVFVDAHLFDQEHQGSRTYLREIYTRLAAKKDLQLFLASYDTNHLRRQFNNDNNIFYLEYKSRSKWNRLLFDIPALLRRNKIDVAHFQYIPPVHKPCPYLVTIHDMLFEEHPKSFTTGYRISKRLLFRYGARKADQLITVSEHSLNSLQHRIQLRNKKVSVISNGVAQRFFDQYDKEKAWHIINEKYGCGSYILYVSRFEPRKNHLALLNAWLELELYKQDIDLVFIGHRSMKVPDLDLAFNSMDKKIADHVKIFNHVTEEELLNFYRAARLFVYSSIAEGFGIPPLEAAAARIPVICSDGSAMEDYVFFGNGHLDASDQGTLTRTIKQYIHQPPSKTELLHISEEVRKKYSWEKAAEEHYYLIKQFANK